MDSTSSLNFSQMKHPRNSKQSFEIPCKTDSEDADGNMCNSISTMSTMDTLPALTGWPSLSHIPTTNTLDDGEDWYDKSCLLGDKDDMDEIGERDDFLASKCISDEGRLCDIKYSDCDDDLLRDPFCSGLNDPFLSELPPEAAATRKCLSLQGLNRIAEVGKVQKRFLDFRSRSSGDEQKHTKLLCNRLLKKPKKKQNEEEDPEVRFLAKVSILTQIAQHAPAHLAVPDEVVEMAEFGEPPGRALWQIVQCADQAQARNSDNSFMPDSKVFGCQDLLGSSSGGQVSAPADDIIMSAVRTMGTLPTLSHVSATNNLDDGEGWDDKDLVPVDKDGIDEIHARENSLAPEYISDQGRLCDINYIDYQNCFLRDPVCIGLTDPLLSELPPEAITTKKCSFPAGLNRIAEVGKVQKRFLDFRSRSSGDEQKHTKLLCNRLLKKPKKKQNEEEDPEVRFLAKVSILTQIAQHADQTQDPFSPDSKDFCHQVTAAMASYSRSLTSKHGAVDLAVVDEAAEMDVFAGIPGRVLRKIAHDVDQALDSFMPDLEVLGRQGSAGSAFGCQVSAPADDLNCDPGFGRQVTASFSSRPKSVTLNRFPVHLAALDAFAGPPGRALRKFAKQADDPRDMLAASQHN